MDEAQREIEREAFRKDQAWQLERDALAAEVEARTFEIASETDPVPHLRAQAQASRDSATHLRERADKAHALAGTDAFKDFHDGIVGELNQGLLNWESALIRTEEHLAHVDVYGGDETELAQRVAVARAAVEARRDAIAVVEPKGE